jgi:vancomycin resistance protein YoaR
MTVGDRPTAPLDTGHDPDIRARRREAQRRARRRRRVALAACAGVAVVAAGLLLGAGGGGIPPKVTIGGIEVGGKSTAEAKALLADRAARLLDGRVRLTAAQAPTFDMTVAASALATRARIDEAIRQAQSSRGRIGRALARLGVAGTKDIPLTFALSDGAVGRLIADAQKQLGQAPVPATVAVDGTEIVTTPARPGRTVDRAELTSRLATLPAEAAIPIHPARPEVDDEDARAARDIATRVVARSRTVTYGQSQATLTPDALRAALRFPARDGTIAVRLDPATLRDELLRPLGVEELRPADARLEIRGSAVAVVPAVLGRSLDAAALGAAIVADPGADAVAATVTTTPPAFTTAEAKALRIKEKISEFTTPYQCCQPRVTNIQRAAKIIDGMIIKPGGRFSLNDALGERTAARGFVTAPMIARGELVDAVGGGVSQVATTTYNAAFFAGLALEAHTPHEFYISRYPMGREATVSWRTPDLVFRNDWPAAILVSAHAGSNGITVAFYSSKLGRRVETTTGTPTGPTEPKTIERPNADLLPGTRKVVQASGAGGFSITYTRKVYRGSRLLRDETFSWRYRPENAIVEVGPPALKPEPKTPPAGGTSTTPGAGGTTTTTPGAGGTTTTPRGGGTPTTPKRGGVPPPPPTD